MKLFWNYIKTKWLLWISLFALTATYMVLFYLYSLPLEPIFYGLLLGLTVILLFVLIDFRFFYKKHCSLQELSHKITVEMPSLPASGNLLEQDYQGLLEQVMKDKWQTVNQNERNVAQMIDYYTAWVHQIKTPISAMRLILQGRDEEDDRELESELFKIEQYVEMVLSYLRLNSDSSDFVIGWVSLNKIVRQAVKKYASLFIRQKIKLEMKPIDVKVLTDEKWLSFVIEQIISNALKYTPQGSITIFAKDQTLVIEDTGIGIAPEDLPRVCERGFTGFNGRLSQKSTGIGLYLSKQILQKLGHTIQITSEVGKGTRVEIALNSKQRLYD